MRTEWLDLSDSEVRARLVQRGVDPFTAAVAVAYREHDVTRWPAFIEQTLKP